MIATEQEYFQAPDWNYRLADYRVRCLPCPACAVQVSTNLRRRFFLEKLTDGDGSPRSEPMSHIIKTDIQYGPRKESAK